MNFRIPIAVKLISLTVLLLVMVAVPIAFVSAYKFEQIAKDRENDNNLEQAKTRATEVEGTLVGLIDKSKIIATQLMRTYQTGEERTQALEPTFARDPDFVAVEVLTRASGATPNRVVNANYLKQYRLSEDYVTELRFAQRAQRIVHLDALFAGKDGYVEVRNSTLPNGAPLLTLGFPLAKDELGNVTHVVLADIRLDRLQRLFASVSVRDLFLIDDQGRLLAHGKRNEARVLKAESLAAVPIVKAALASSLKQEQIHYGDQSGAQFTAAFAKTALGVSVVASVPDEVILEGARQVRRQALAIAGCILSLALFFITVFSLSLTSPIEALAELTSRVARGDFSAKANVNSRDEVGQLGEAFNHMIEGLQERDKVKSMFSKFHGSSVTEDLLKGNLQLGGSKKMVTVFFSDIRDFTKFSEGHTPEEVVQMLNEYFHIMVKIINVHGGVVDKFIGDAIMAVWGAPNTSPRDSQNAVRACIEMRRALADLNALRRGRGQEPIRIGMGLHRGEAISGTIGSDERMEYTVIGDTVNQASRIEASTKTFGTDLLLSESLADVVREDFLLDVAGRVEVKGKTEPLSLFRVRGYYDEARIATEVRTEYSEYRAEDGDKVKIA